MQVSALGLTSRFIALVITFLLIGCGGYQYVASPRYVPMNEKKGDININVSLAGAQLGYAFSNKFSVFATGFNRWSREQKEEGFLGIGEPKTCVSKEINLGLTYFGGKKKFRYEVVTGGGMGKMAFSSAFSTVGLYDYDRTMDVQADKWNVYIQPNFSYKIHERVDKHLALAVFAKFNSCNYYNTIVTRVSDATSIKRRSETQVIGLSSATEPYGTYGDGFVYFSNHEKSNLLFIEPGIFVKAGTKYFKGITQFSYVINASGPSLYYQPYSITLGVAINFNVFDLKAANRNSKK